MTTRNPHIGSTLESFFEELGELQEVQTLALKKMIADELRAALDASGLTMVGFAKAMGTSRPVAYRLLNPDESGLTIDTLVSAAIALGQQVHVTFTPNEKPKRNVVDISKVVRPMPRKAHRVAPHRPTTRRVAAMKK